MKYAAVYKIKNKLIFCSNAETTDGVGLSIPPYIEVESEAPSEDIAAAIREVLESSQRGVPHPKTNEWGGISKKHLQGLGVKFLSVLHKKASYCSIKKDGNELTFYPTLNAGPIEGYKFLPEMNKSIIADAPPEQVATALKEALLISEGSEAGK